MRDRNMTARLSFAVPAALLSLLLSSVILGAAFRESPQRAGDSGGWQIPANAANDANPVATSPEVLAKGRELYQSKCRRCHGTNGKGNGPDADSDNPPGDLTDVGRAPRNPDGVMFYKVWNGRSKPKMPAFKTDLSREDVWRVIHFTKTLRGR
jgi:mono/diheme cytochrome c family protein